MTEWQISGVGILGDALAFQAREEGSIPSLRTNPNLQD